MKYYTSFISYVKETNDGAGSLQLVSWMEVYIYIASLPAFQSISSGKLSLLAC